MDGRPVADTDSKSRHIQTAPLRLLLLLLLVVLLGAFVGNSLAAAVFLQSGIDLQLFTQNQPMDMPRFTRDILRLTTLITHLCTFSIPAILVAIFSYRDQWDTALGIHKRPRIRELAFGILFLMISFPLAQYVYWWNLKFPLPEALLEMEQAAGKMVKAFLVMDDLTELGLNLLTVGFVAAFGEELIFRGLVQPKLSQVLRNAHVGIWITALLFSAIHFQFAGFLPRMLLGVVLGYLYLWSRNLWVPIVAHLVFNGMQILAQYFFEEKMDQIDPENMSQPHWLVGILPLLALIWIGREIQKRQTNNRSWL